MTIKSYSTINLFESNINTIEYLSKYFLLSKHLHKHGIILSMITILFILVWLNSNLYFELDQKNYTLQTVPGYILNANENFSQFKTFYPSQTPNSTQLQAFFDNLDMISNVHCIGGISNFFLIFFSCQFLKYVFK